MCITFFHGTQWMFKIWINEFLLKSDLFTIHLQDKGSKNDNSNALQSGQFMKPSSGKSMNIEYAFFGCKLRKK